MAGTSIAELEAADAALDGFLKQMNKGGTKNIRAFDDESVDYAIPSIPTGALSLDLALGLGGIPRGRVTELFGPEGSGKSSLAVSIAAQANKMGLNALVVDAEHAMSKDMIVQLGADPSKTFLNQPDSGNEGLDVAISAAESGAFAVIIIDSVAALTPKEELEGAMEDQQMGAQARMMAKGMRKIVKPASRTDTAVILINQLREQIGVMYGNPEKTPGGRAVKFAASVRLSVRAPGSGAIKDGKTQIGHTCTVTVKKNKVGPPHGKAEYDLIYGKGIRAGRAIAEAAKELGALEIKGSHWYFPEDVDKGSDHSLANSKDNMYATLDADPELAEQVRQRVLDAQRAADDDVIDDHGEYVDAA